MTRSFRSHVVPAAITVLALAAPAVPQQGSPRVVPQQPAPRTAPRQTAPGAANGPRLEAVAETKLLMQGISQPNFRALEKLLTKEPEDAEAWKFARGQALLLAENANLLMLRPPRNDGETAWMDRATGLRTAATRLARSLAKQEYEPSRTGLRDVANACNRCHQGFRVNIRLTPFAAPAEERPPRQNDGAGAN